MDVRDVLTEKKHYTHLPHPLLKMLYKMKLTQSEERVYQAHWGAGQINGDWVSRIAISTLSETLCISESTVKRAYQGLASKGLIKRYPQGRSVSDPMRSAITLTEVLVPEEAISELLDTPDRAPAKEQGTTRLVLEGEHDSTSACGKGDGAATENALPGVEPDPESCGQEKVKAGQQFCREFSGYIQKVVRKFDRDAGRVKVKHVHILRKALRQRLEGANLNRVLNQMLWSMAHGQLCIHHPAHSMNIALKLLSRDRWATPFAMPDAWEWQDHILER